MSDVFQVELIARFRSQRCRPECANIGRSANCFHLKADPSVGVQLRLHPRRHR